MPKTMPWLKFYVEVLDDEKLADFTDAEYRMWTYLLLLARDSSAPGVIGLSVDQIAWRTRRSQELVNVTLDKCVTKGMVTRDAHSVTFTNFRRRQDKKPSDAKEESRERKRRSREKAKGHPPEPRVTSRVGHAPSRAPEVEEEVEGEEEVEVPPTPKQSRRGIGAVAEVWDDLGFARDLANSGETYAYATATIASGVDADHVARSLRAAHWFVENGADYSLLTIWKNLVEKTTLGGKFRWDGEEAPDFDEDGEAESDDPVAGTGYTLARPKAHPRTGRSS